MKTARDSGWVEHYELVVALVAALVFFGCIVSPPSLMDDVDSVQAQIARNMLQSGDWVTARLDGIPYLEKSPLKYWMMAISFAIFGATASTEFSTLTPGESWKLLRAKAPDPIGRELLNFQQDHPGNTAAR